MCLNSPNSQKLVPAKISSLKVAELAKKLSCVKSKTLKWEISDLISELITKISSCKKTKELFQSEFQIYSIDLIWCSKQFKWVLEKGFVDSWKLT